MASHAVYIVAPSQANRAGTLPHPLPGVATMPDHALPSPVPVPVPTEVQMSRGSAVADIVDAGTSAVTGIARIRPEQAVTLFAFLLLVGAGVMVYLMFQDAREDKAVSLRREEESRVLRDKQNEESREKDRSFHAQQREKDRAATAELVKEMRAWFGEQERENRAAIASLNAEWVKWRESLIPVLRKLSGMP